MFIILGFLVVFGSILLGYTSHGGQVSVLIQPSEFIIIGGAGLGATLIGNSPRAVKNMCVSILGLVKPNPYTKEVYAELLQALYEVFQTAKKDGLMGLESHVEDPAKSEIFSKHPFFSAHHAAVEFLTDNVKVLLTGAVDEYHLAEILDLDLDRHHEEAMTVPASINKIADAMPAFGIVAAVLGVVITMGSINAGAETVGRNVAAALVGTFLGVLLAYGVFAPLGQAVASRVHSEHAYITCIRTALLSFVRGDAPMTSVEFARRSVEPAQRPSFEDLESMTRKPAGGAETTPQAKAA